MLNILTEPSQGCWPTRQVSELKPLIESAELAVDEVGWFGDSKGRARSWRERESLS